MQALVTAKYGFELAELDLKFRGPGEVYGTTQSGFPEFSLASLTDYELIQQAKETAQNIIKADRSLEHYPELKNKMNSFLETIHLE